MSDNGSKGSIFPDHGVQSPRMAVRGRMMGGRKRDRIALVLAGGGITGAVYEIGALRAIDDMLVDIKVNDFDIFVGTSAGALVNAFIANGFTPREIMQFLDNRHPEIRGFGVSDVFHTNIEGMLHRLRRLPKTLYDVAHKVVFHFGDVAISDIIWELAQVLPNGLYDGNALERYVRSILNERGVTNRFDQLDRELYIVATELETGKRAVFGQGGKSVVPVSQAVAASSAVPVLYRPVRIFDRDYLDGGLHGSASLDLAIEAGAKLVVCINPMVPLNTSNFADRHYIREHGIQAIINQTVRTLLHSTVRYHIKNLRTKYPDVDIILIQPQFDDHRLFSYNPMYFSSRMTVAEHGFETVSLGILKNFEYFRNVLLRHDIELTANVVTEELAEIRANQAKAAAEYGNMRRKDQHLMLSAALVDLEASLLRLNSSLGDH